ncbi:Endonuclease/exonuclease/phosphatase [Artemisia annua]|uniref:Endonuclease/exonuclease/phosphatase n=1 Tax=Artemisia annua TaxID=35608 RepID=A0A2U1PUN5_ARTAN|nr:Endonuclease/exonuclease/phosphatase [Artemisia annua]
MAEFFIAAATKVSLDASLQRPVRGGLEQHQFAELASIIDQVSLSPSLDRWVCSLSSDGSFSVKEARIAIDEVYLPQHTESTRWVKVVPIKVNIFVWRAWRDCLPTRTNLIRRGVSVESSSCPLCHSGEEDVHHVLFRCNLSRAVLRRVCRWWDLDWQDWSSFSEWYSWFSSIRFPSNVKSLLEGVFFVTWWSIWGLRNRTIFDVTPPTRSMIFDDIVSLSFHWCYNRCDKRIWFYTRSDSTDVVSMLQTSYHNLEKFLGIFEHNQRLTDSFLQFDDVLNCFFDHHILDMGSSWFTYPKI